MRLHVSLKTALLVFLVLMVATAGILYWLTAIHPFESTDNAYLKAHSTLISPKETGYVKEVVFEDNQTVKAGDLLVIIDAYDFETRVAQAEGQVKVEAARVQTLETTKRVQHAKIQQEEANIHAVEADLERVARDVMRFTSLVVDGAVSAQSHDVAKASYKQAAAQREKYRAARKEAASQLVSIEAQIDEARARMNVAEASLELARINLANTRITAPIAGTIGNRTVQVGQLVKPGTALAYLIPAEGLFIEANFKETQIEQIQPGQPVAIHVEAYPNHAFEGTVDSFAPASGAEFSLLPPDNATGNFTKVVRRVPVKLSFHPGTDLNGLKPGLSAVVKVKVR